MARNLLVGEEALRVARQHWSVFVPTVSVCIIVLGLGMLVVRAMPETLAGRSLHEGKVTVSVALLVVAAVVLTARWLRWRFTTFTLTTRRIVVSKGILSRYMESIALDRIQDTSVRQGLAGRLARAGDVEIESAGRDGSEVLRLIGDPVGFSNDLMTAIEAHRTGQAVATAWPGEALAAPPGSRPPLPRGYAPPGGEVPPPAGYGPAPGYAPPPRPANPPPRRER